MRHFLLLLLISGCGNSETGEHARGQALYKLQGCHTCHGKNGQGLVTAPALHDLGRFWKREDLIEYFANPRAFAGKNEHLDALRERFSIEMPAISATLDERAALADYVLGF